MIERHGELFITRVYTDSEIEYCTTRKAATQHYAGRWAAKEAVLKGWVPAGDAELDGAILKFATTKTRSDRQTPRRSPRCDGSGRHPGMHVTISHCRSFAVAYVVAEG